MSLIRGQYYKSCAELAMACQQWVQIGSCYQAALFAKAALEMAREEYPGFFRRFQTEVW